jgi:hypothetical protein
VRVGEIDVAVVFTAEVHPTLISHVNAPYVVSGNHGKGAIDAGDPRAESKATSSSLCTQNTGYT